MSDLPFGRRVSVDGGVQSITLIHGPSSLLPPMLLLYDRPLTMPLFPSRISVVLSHHLSLEDRRTDERLSRARNAPFLFFTSGVPGEREQSIRVLSFPRGLAGIKLLPRRELMLPAVNSFYFSRWGSFRGGARSNSFSPCLTVTQPANKGFLLQRRQSEPDRPSFTA